ncbi:MULTISPECIES: histone deacetylase [unclassified Streptomyces]|uniref:histone deacetylase n=1 Tax=unclassified Streptomyces TaxID=2593676 RepID=UPI000DC7D965|nr:MULTISPECIES: histone deacetylase [unclassified Streptomyces]AWZ09586.1 histone deacetylase [Streptomyces sp. ICC4]AWZ17321.1 histone deacetylase [Streptomyces sp. ICC1]
MVVHTAVPLGGEGAGGPGRVWYASYGSNMHLDRLAAYIGGGRPHGGARTYPGCRDRRAPERSIAVELAGRLYFATESPVWTGGRGFYDPTAPGRTRARAHLVSVGQLSDIAAQEMYEEPGADLDLTAVLRLGRAELGPGRYETLICPGTIGGIPLLTFTAPWTLRDVEPLMPAAAYLRHLAGGLLESGPWAEPDIADYLSSCPGASGNWTPAHVLELLTGGSCR